MDAIFTCEVCTKEKKKYKCPKCSILYCSLSCYKLHQHYTCNARREAAVITKVVAEKTTCVPVNREAVPHLDDDEIKKLGDEVPISQLHKLTESETLIELLHNQHLRDYLLKLSTSTNLDKSMERAMHEPLFLEFANECLRIVELRRCTSSP